MADRRTPAWIVALVLAAGCAGAVGIVAPEIFTASLSDVGTFLRVVLFGVALAGWVLVVSRFIGGRYAGLVKVVPVAVVLGWALSPYVGPPTVVDDAFPVFAAAPTTIEDVIEPSTSVVGSSTTSAPTTTSIPPVTATSGAEIASRVPTSPPQPIAPPPTAPATTIAAEPVLLRSGAFQGLTGHSGEGQALVYDLPDRSRLLRLEDVNIGPGPALKLYLVPGPDQRSLGGAIGLGDLKGEQGNQNYTVPADVDLTTGVWTVLVWCETFAVEIANATLA